jgi:hypothetical protein
MLDFGHACSHPASDQVRDQHAPHHEDAERHMRSGVFTPTLRTLLTGCGACVGAESQTRGKANGAGSSERRE